MSFQWILDNAESLSINRKRTVSLTKSRDGTVRTVSRGVPPKRFEIKLPDGIPWTQIKDNIELAESLDRITNGTLTISYSKFPWYYNNISGTDETYTVRCIEFPEWTIFARNQVSWSGPFIFIEVV